MSKESISYLDMKTVIEVNDYQSAQRRIDEGWYLLSVGFDTGEYGSKQVYILGNTSKITKKKSFIEAVLADEGVD